MVSDTVYNDIINIIESELGELDLECVGSEMLLLALVSLKESMTCLIFHEMGIGKEKIKALIKESYFLRKSGAYTLKFYELVKKAESLMSEKEYVYDEAYLYSILSVKDTVAKDFLKRLGVEEAIVLEELDNAQEYLDKDSRILVNMTKLAREGKLNPFIGRFNYIDKIDRILCKKQKNNPMLIGSAGVGKSGLVEGVTQYYLSKNPKTIIYRLDLGSVIAGTRYRGDLEERLLDAIDEIKDDKAIVFIDEIHNIMASNSNEASLDIANILKPVLSRSEIKCIGATTTEEYYKYIYKDKALVRRFQNVFVDEVTDEECLEILKGIKQGYTDYYHVEYTDDILKYIIEVSKLMTTRKLPDKAIDILDESGLITQRKKESTVSQETIVDLIFEYIGIDRKTCFLNLTRSLNYPQLIPYYEKYLNMNSNFNIVNIQCISRWLVLDDLKTIFGVKEEMMVYIDLNDFIDNHFASNLIGAPSGYIGYENGGLLTEHLLKHAFAIVIIKNYTSSGAIIKGIIKRAIENGYLIDNRGRNISIKNTIFIFEEMNVHKLMGFINNTMDKKVDSFINIVLEK